MLNNLFGTSSGTKRQISDLAESIVTGEVPSVCHDDLEDIEKVCSF